MSKIDVTETLELWREYVDPMGLYTPEEFEDLTPEARLKILADCGWDPDFCAHCDGTSRVGCATCDSTGEGYHDGARCGACKGRGDHACPKCLQDDWDPPYDDDRFWR